MKKLTRTQAKKKAWATFSKYVRLRDAFETTNTPDYLLCITCGKRYPAFGKGCAQAGHFIPGRSNAVLIDDRFVHGQCYNCNINLRGNWVEFEKKMIAKWGVEAVEQAKRDSRNTVIITADEWIMIEQTYQHKLDQLTNSKKRAIIKK